MAQTDATQLSAFSGFLRPEIAQPYFDEARKRSTVMQLARQIPLGINGQEIPYSTTKASAAWVSEAGKKPTTESGIALASIAPKKIAAISVSSAEVVRANPGNYMQILRDDVAEAFGVAFDAAALHGTSTPFDAYVDETTKEVELGVSTAAEGGAYADIVAGLSLLANDGKKLRGFAFDAVAEPVMLSNVDANGRPLWIDTPLTDTADVVRPGRLIGRPGYIGDNVASGDIVGYGGDWTKCVWGVVGGINYRVSTEGAVTLNGELVSLFENNLVAILAEAEYGFLCHDAESFVKYTYTLDGS